MYSDNTIKETFTDLSKCVLSGYGKFENVTFGTAEYLFPFVLKF